MKLLILGLNYSPEPIGIGPYTAGLAEALAEAGHDIRVVTSHPYYPAWRRQEGYPRVAYRREKHRGVRIIRCPLYVPAKPSGVKRILHHLSFAATASIPAIWLGIRWRPDLVLTIAPSLLSSPIARWAARPSGAATWLHIQDFEIEAAFATGLLDPKSRSGRLALAFQRWTMRGFDIFSSISPQMCARLYGLGIPNAQIVEFRNWADLSSVSVLDRPSVYRDEWNITTPHVALYSGNISNKQGIDLVVEAARLLKERHDITFVICGNGAQRASLEASAAGMDMIRFHDLQPRERLGELVGLATIHLLPQLAGAADLVLPSKLTNILASGRPVVATAMPDTGLAKEVEGCGVVTPPGDAASFANAIVALADNPALRTQLGAVARQRAERRWSKTAIVNRLITQMEKLRSDAAD